jgi:hypothetical protein
VKGTRLLLREAVKGAQAQDEVQAVNADNLAVRKDFGEGAEGKSIGRVVEGGN